MPAHPLSIHAHDTAEDPEPKPPTVSFETAAVRRRTQTTSTPAAATAARRARIGIRRLHWLILSVMAVSLVGFSGGVMLLVRQIFDDFGPAVRKDLEWQVVHGAQELARGADLGLAVHDARMVTEAFGDLRAFEDVVAVVAVDGNGVLVAQHGGAPEALEALFAGPAGTVRTTPGYLVAWAAATIEGSVVGRVALVISTRRLVEARVLLRRISFGTAGAAAIALLCGILFVNFFTGTIAARDAQLAGYASHLEVRIAERTAELDGRNREMRLVFDHVEQGLVAVSMDGVMRSERSTVFDRWFGVPAPNARFEDQIRAGRSSDRRLVLTRPASAGRRHAARGAAAGPAAEADDTRRAHVAPGLHADRR